MKWRSSSRDAVLYLSLDASKPDTYHAAVLLACTKPCMV